MERLMNICLALINALKRFCGYRESPHAVKQCSYVFVLVPLDFRANGHAEKTEVGQDLTDNGSHARSTWTQALFSALAALKAADQANKIAVPAT
jgi:hypothetical protein